MISQLQSSVISFDDAAIILFQWNFLFTDGEIC